MGPKILGLEMLVEIAIADGYGSGFEFAPRDFVRKNNNLQKYIAFHTGREGRYTDDTQMSLAIAEVLISGDQFTPEILAEWFVVAYKRDPRAGYARRFRAFLEEIEDGAEFLKKMQPESRRCGAAMRAPPLGVLRDPKEVREKAEIQARITHDTLIGMRSASAAALATHYFVYDLGPKSKLGKWLESQVSGKWQHMHKGKVGMQGCQVVRAALTAIVQGSTMSDILRRCVAFTGDVDSVAAIALAAASCSQETEQDLPAHLVRDLEDGPYGRTYIEDIDDQLMSMT